MTTRRSGSSPCRKLIWARQPAVNLTMLAGATQTVDLLANFETAYGAQLIGCTVMRIRGSVQTRLVTINAANVQQPVIVASIVTAALVTPTGPLSDPHADWMQYDSVYPMHGADAAGFPMIGNHVFDVKSRRKIDELSQRCLMQFTNTNGGSTVEGVMSVSTLLMLP